VSARLGGRAPPLRAPASGILSGRAGPAGNSRVIVHLVVLPEPSDLGGWNA